MSLPMRVNTSELDSACLVPKSYVVLTVIAYLGLKMYEMAAVSARLSSGSICR